MSIALAGPLGPGGVPDVEGFEALAEAVEQQTGLFVPVRPAQGISTSGVVNGEILTEGNDNVVALAGLNRSTGEAYVFCSGSQIADQWILTAAHCISGSNDVLSYGGMTLVVLWGGDIIRDGYTTAIDWAQGISDPTYNAGAFTNDAGLVELAEAKEDVEWMVLNDAPVDAIWTGTEVTFYGFGITSDFADDAGTKRTTQVPLESADTFNFYTFSPQTNVCSGDSGGPSTFEGPKGPEQIGVNAFVEGGCIGGSAGSTRVDNHIDWIREYVPGVALDFDDLPKEEVVVPEGDDSRPRSWNDLGADDANGLAGQWDPGVAVPRGCNQVPGAPLWAGLVPLILVVRRRIG